MAWLWSVNLIMGWSRDWEGVARNTGIDDRGRDYWLRGNLAGRDVRTEGFSRKPSPKISLFTGKIQGFSLLAFASRSD